ncbi:polyprenyl synthetase family protein, partial [Cellulomonas oligotrophica]|uniref:polyprenyl synthetase family protein n=1 Tax=Cellulomonas oligotrophica TaxID=931536 RepID=UPI0031E5701C
MSRLVSPPAACCATSRSREVKPGLAPTQGRTTRRTGFRVVGAKSARSLRAVSSLELIQACALVQDDLMDDSDMRRGQPTVHVAFAAKHRELGWSGGAERFGLSAALLLGDLA